MEKLILCLCLTFLLQQIGCENFVNIALHKTPTQNGTLQYPAGTFWNVSNSVDGLTACTSVDGQHYSATADENDPWWQLDLGSIYTIKAMHLLGRPDTPQQLGGFRLWTGLDIDYLSMMYNAKGTDYNNGNIWVNISIEARVIKIDLPRDVATGRVLPGPLTLCEVEVLICRPGFYGDKCSVSCGNCNDGTNKCLALDGTCPTGCAPGYNYTSDKTCKTACSPGYYGHNCLENCGQCINGNTCLSADGTCQDGCAPGYNHTDRTCHTICSPGYYGQNCLKNCGQCTNGNTKCLPADGMCQDGCAPGYYHTDNTCHTKCQAGYYGFNCKQNCGQCFDGNTSCSVVDGSCPSGCAPGYNISVDVKCNQECQLGHYGINCAETCGHCIDGTTCSFTDGTCPAGCGPGYNYTANKTCNTDKTCPPSTYTVHCIPCGHCNAGLPCDDITGRCPNGCETGYSGDMCKQAKNTGNSFCTKDVIGAAIGGMIGGAIFILLIVMLVHRRNKLRCPWVCQTSQDYESPKPREITDGQNMYDVLDIPDMSDQSVSGTNPATPHYQNTNI